MFARLLPYLRLIRFSNAPTAAADIIAGFLLGMGVAESTGWWNSVEWILILTCVICSSVCIYSWGMVLNDLCDFDADLASRSGRPLPSGEISLGTGYRVAIGLVVASAVFFVGALAIGIGSVLHFEVTLRQVLDPVVVFVSLVLAIWLYDGPLKKTALAPFVMGSCRGLNLLLGASLPVCLIGGTLSSSPADLWVLVLALSLFVAGLTWFARREESGGVWWQLLLGLTLMLMGYACMGFGLLTVEDRPPVRLQLMTRSGVDWLWPVAVGLISFPVLRKAFVAVASPSPHSIKLAIIAALGNLVFIDGLICMYAAPHLWGLSLAVAGFIVPITLLKRYIPPT